MSGFAGMLSHSKMEYLVNSAGISSQLKYLPSENNKVSISPKGIIWGQVYAFLGDQIEQ